MRGKLIAVLVCLSILFSLVLPAWAADVTEDRNINSGKVIPEALKTEEFQKEPATKEEICSEETEEVIEDSEADSGQYEEEIIEAVVEDQSEYSQCNKAKEANSSSNESNTEGLLASLEGDSSSDEQEEMLQHEIEQIISLLGVEDKSAYEKIFSIYNYVCQNVEYDWAATDIVDSWDGVSSGYGQLAYDALCEGKAVCAGISDAIAQLLWYVDIDCYYITGTEQGMPHAWNLVCLEGTYYYLDATADLGQMTYTRFLKGSDNWSSYEAFPWYDLSCVSISNTDYIDSVNAEFTEVNDFTVNIGTRDITIFSYSGSDKNVVVPAKINGRSVKRIAQYAFYENDGMKTLTISEGIKRITCLFVGQCRNLEMISIPSTAELVAIGSDRFVTGLDGFVEGCDSLRTILVSNNNPYLTVIDGALYNKECTDLIAYPRAAQNKEVTIPEGVTSIKSDAFAGNCALEKVTFPDTVTSIGFWAFDYCTSLCEINIPPNCEFIGQYAFHNTAIKSIFIPAGVQNCIIMPTSFSGAPLELIEVEEGNMYYSVKDGALYADKTALLLYEVASEREEFEVPEGVTSIQMSSFEGAKNLKRISISSTVSFIGIHAFYGCNNLKEISIENGTVETIGEGAFSDCSSLTNAPILDSVISIGEWAFSGCSSLTSVTIPDRVTRIECGTFSRCSGLTSITIPDSVTSIESASFSGCSSLTSVTLGNGVTTIGDSAFYSCSSLSSVTIPDSVNSIGHEAFGNCSSLTSIHVSEDNPIYCAKDGILFTKDMTILCCYPKGKTQTQTSYTIPDGVISVGNCAFAYCGSLRCIVIPDSVTAIEEAAFIGCGGLTDVYYSGSQDDWKQITIGNSNTCLRDVTIHYNWDLESEPEPTPKPPATTFTDVPSGAYYAPAVNWAVANNITAGTTPTTFSPNNTCTRGQIVAFLWRAAGRPEPETTKNPFTDVKTSDYFYKAVLWASENGIVYGTSGTTFSPNQGCTRGQVAAFLWRAAGRPEPTTGNNPFTDVKTSEYYGKAVVWAAENKIVYGTSATQFSPNASCTRAQIVTFLYRTYASK